MKTKKIEMKEKITKDVLSLVKNYNLVGKIKLKTLDSKNPVYVAKYKKITIFSDYPMEVEYFPIPGNTQIHNKQIRVYFGEDITIHVNQF